jgi:hypothetical protein
MISDPVLFAASKIPSLTSCEKASCSNACAIFTGLPPFFSTARSIATSRYWFAGDNTAKKYYKPFVNKILMHHLLHHKNLYFSVTGAMA